MRRHTRLRTIVTALVHHNVCLWSRDMPIMATSLERWGFGVGFLIVLRVCTESGARLPKHWIWSVVVACVLQRGGSTYGAPRRVIAASWAMTMCLKSL